MTLTKENLIQTLYDQAGFSKHKSRAVVETVFELVKKALESGEDVLISGFGKFSVRKKAPRKGRNPIFDLEYPRIGFITVDSADQVLIDLRASMK